MTMNDLEQLVHYARELRLNVHELPTWDWGARQLLIDTLLVHFINYVAHQQGHFFNVRIEHLREPLPLIGETLLGTLETTSFKAEVIGDTHQHKYIKADAIYTRYIHRGGSYYVRTLTYVCEGCLHEVELTKKSELLEHPPEWFQRAGALEIDRLERW